MNKENIESPNQKPRLDEGELIGHVSYRDGDLHIDPLPVESPNVQEGKQIVEQAADKYANSFF